MYNSLVRTLKFAALMTLGGTALMQASEHVKFHLSNTTHWGNAVLQPGDYTMILPEDSIGRHQIRIDGQGSSVYVFPLLTDTTDTSESSRLELKEVNGETFVKGLYCGRLGKQYLFHTPKGTQHAEQVGGM